MELDGLRMIASLTFDGYGPAILPATAVPGHLRERFALLPLEGIPRRRVGVALRSRGLPSAPTRAVIEILTRSSTTPTAAGRSAPGDRGPAPLNGLPPRRVTRGASVPATSARGSGRPGRAARRSPRSRGAGRRHVLLLGGLEVGRYAVGVAAGEDRGQEGRADAAALQGGLGAQRGQVPVGLAGVSGLQLGQETKGPGKGRPGVVGGQREHPQAASAPRSSSACPGGPKVAVPAWSSVVNTPPKARW